MLLFCTTVKGGLFLQLEVKRIVLLLSDTVAVLKSALGIDRSRISTHRNIPNSQENGSKKSPENLKENIPSQQNFLYKMKEEK